MAQEFRIGQGLDVHRLVDGRPCIIGGVEIPFHKGLEGHSDADVLLHAIIDALFGAAGLPDIGAHFSNKEERWRNISSLELLSLAWAEVHALSWSIANIDCSLLAEAPKIAPHIPEMKARIAKVLGCTAGQIGIKATTNEKMGFIGRGEGILAQAVALLYRG